MKAIIPAKRHSSRVPDKNWRPFHKDKSLTEIKIEQVLRAFVADDVVLSCDDAGMAEIAARYGIGWSLRPAPLAADSTPWPDALAGIVAATPFGDEEDIAWIEVINPLFDDYGGMRRAWTEACQNGHDSLVLAAPFHKFLLRPDGMPFNFLPGRWHAASQHLQPLFVWDSACMMKKRDLLYFRYPIGRTPFLYSTGTAAVDIDTMNDFIIAQHLYAARLDS